jgi:hypothetical protein
MIFTGPVWVVRVAAESGNAGRDFCFRSECRSRPVTIREWRAAWLAVTARAARAGREVLAVTRDWRIEVMAARRMVVKETWSVPAGWSWRRPAAAGSPVATAAAPLALTSWAAASQAQSSW